MNKRRIKAAVKVTSQKISSRHKKSGGDPADTANCQAYLKQAEVCREQAHDAVRLKRWKAACGLFATAVALCNRAVTMGGDACTEAKETLRQMQTEMATYSELARSMEKPLLATPTLTALATEKNRDVPSNLL